MAKFSVGTTRSGKTIFIDTSAQRQADISANLITFSDHDSFDTLLATEFLFLRERRRGSLGDPSWLDSLDLTRSAIDDLLGQGKIAVIKYELGLDSVFKCRDFGKARVYSYLRNLIWGTPSRDSPIFQDTIC